MSAKNLAMLCVLLVPTPAAAQHSDQLPKELEGVGISENLDAQIPLDLPFVDSNGRQVTLRQFFDGTRPVILTMNYSNCPMLCILQLNGLVETMQQMSWDLGQQYQIVTVSIDPRESWERAKLQKQKYLQRYGRPGVAEGWHFLTGREEDIQRLADTVGFHFVYVPERNEFAHLAVLMICTPDGRVSRYLPGVKYDPQTLRLSLVEASEGKVGSPMDQVLMFCFHYDPESHRYGPAAFRLMRIGAVLTLLLLGGMLAWFWRREAHRSKALPAEGKA